jgi:hypothetical protein
MNMKRLIISTRGKKSFLSPARMYGKLRGEKKVLLTLVEKPSDANDTETEYLEAFGIGTISFSFSPMTLKEYKSEKKKALLNLMSCAQGPINTVVNALKNK